MQRARIQSRLSLLAAASSLLALVAAGPALADKWAPSIDAIGQAGSAGGGGGLDLIVPLYQDDDTIFFANVMGGLNSDSSAGAAAGLVLRLQIDESVILGGFAYGDWLRSDSDKVYYQATGGLEAMTEDWDLRAIGYAPLTGEKTLAQRAALDGTDGIDGQPGVGTGNLVVQGNELGILWEGQQGSLGVDGFRTQEALLHGFEAEAGWKLPLDRTLGSDWEVRSYLGGYWFAADGYDTFAGPRARLELRGYDLAYLGDGARVTLGAEASWDDPRGFTGAGLLRVRIPFGWIDYERKELTALDRRMVDPIPRRLAPFTDRRHEVLVAAAGSEGGAGVFEAVEATETGNEIATIHFASGTGGGNGTAADAGTADDPTDLASAVADAGAGGLVVVLGGAGSLTGSAELLANQIVIGGDTDIEVAGLTSGSIFTFDADNFSSIASRPTIVSDVAAGGVTLGATTVGNNGTWLAGMNVQLGDLASQRSGIFHVDTSNHLVQDVDVTGGLIGFGAQTSAAGMTVENLRFEDITTDGTNAGFTLANQVVGATLRNVTVEGATLSNGTDGALGRSIFFSANNASTIGNVTLNDVDIVNGGVGGVLFANVSNMTINDMTVAGRAGLTTSSSGINFQTSIDDANNNIAVDGLTISGYGSALRLGNLQTAAFNDVTLTDNLLLGIDMNSSDDVSFTNVSIVGTGTLAGLSDTAFRITDSTGITVQNVSIDGETTGGTAVTDIVFQLQPNTSITFVGTNTGNTTANVPSDCNVSGAGTVTGAISYDDLDNGAGVVTCPP